MNNKLLIIVGVVVIGTLGGVYIRSQHSNNNNQIVPKPTGAMEKTENATTEPTRGMVEKTVTPSGSTNKDEGTMMKNESRYVVYSKTAFETAKGKKRIYFFHAPWCPTCRPADAAFQKDAALIPENVVLFKTDYDTSAELKKQYAVTYQHTFIQVDENGREVTRWNGGAIAELTANIR